MVTEAKDDGVESGKDEEDATTLLGDDALKTILEPSAQ